MPISPTELKIGAKAAPFNLLGTDGKYYSLNDFDDKKILCIIFTCNHCPYVKSVENRINKIAKTNSKRSFALVCINPNDASTHPEDSFSEMIMRANEKNYSFPYLRDDTQETAKAYDAVCTPDVFVFDKDRNLKYRGRIDDNWKNSAAVTRNELQMAIDLLLEDKEIDFEMVPTMGCSIKWKNN